jgi:hypothetical protein
VEWALADPLRVQAAEPNGNDTADDVHDLATHGAFLNNYGLVWVTGHKITGLESVVNLRYKVEVLVLDQLLAVQQRRLIFEYGYVVVDVLRHKLMFDEKWHAIRLLEYLESVHGPKILAVAIHFMHKALPNEAGEALQPYQPKLELKLQHFQL